MATADQGIFIDLNPPGDGAFEMSSNDARILARLNELTCRVSDIYAGSEELPGDVRDRLFKNAQEAIFLCTECRPLIFDVGGREQLGKAIARCKEHVSFGEQALKGIHHA